MSSSPPVIVEDTAAANTIEQPVHSAESIADVKRTLDSNVVQVAEPKIAAIVVEQAPPSYEDSNPTTAANPVTQQFPPPYRQAGSPSQNQQNEQSQYPPHYSPQTAQAYQQQNVQPYPQFVQPQFVQNVVPTTTIVYSRTHFVGGYVTMFFAMVFSAIALACSSGTLVSSDNYTLGWMGFYSFNPLQINFNQNGVSSPLKLSYYQLSTLSTKLANVGIVFAVFSGVSLLVIIIAMTLQWFMHYSANAAMAVQSRIAILLLLSSALVLTLVSSVTFTVVGVQTLQNINQTAISPTFGVIIAFINVAILLPLSIVFSALAKPYKRFAVVV